MLAEPQYKAKGFEHKRQDQGMDLFVHGVRLKIRASM